LEGLMQSQDDDFPYTSDDPSLAPLDDKNSALSLTSQQVNDIKGTLRLVIGSAMTGTDAFTKRLRQIQANQETVKPAAIVIDENETARDQLRYLLLGMLFEAPDLLQRSLESVEHASSKVYGLFSKLLSPITNSWIFSPVKGQYDGAVTRGERVIDRLIMKGRIEEQNSRLILQQKAIDDLVNEILEYVILETDATQIIQEGGVGVAGGVLDEFREQSSNVDSLLDSKLKGFFRRTPSQPGVPPADQADGGK
jgi:hypothetical protein